MEIFVASSQSVPAGVHSDVLNFFWKTQAHVLINVLLKKKCVQTNPREHRVVEMPKVITRGEEDEEKKEAEVKNESKNVYDEKRERRMR